MFVHTPSRCEGVYFMYKNPPIIYYIYPSFIHYRNAKTAKLKSAKYNSRQYFRLYGILYTMSTILEVGTYSQKTVWSLHSGVHTFTGTFKML